MGEDRMWMEKLVSSRVSPVRERVKFGNFEFSVKVGMEVNEGNPVVSGNSNCFEQVHIFSEIYDVLIASIHAGEQSISRQIMHINYSCQGF